MVLPSIELAPVRCGISASDSGANESASGQLRSRPGATKRWPHRARGGGAEHQEADQPQRVPANQRLSAEEQADLRSHPEEQVEHGERLLRLIGEHVGQEQRVCDNG